MLKWFDLWLIEKVVLESWKSSEVLKILKKRKLLNLKEANLIVDSKAHLSIKNLLYIYKR
jgi:hypothetical protein